VNGLLPFASCLGRVVRSGRSLATAHGALTKGRRQWECGTKKELFCLASSLHPFLPTTGCPVHGTSRESQPGARQRALGQSLFHSLPRKHAQRTQGKDEGGSGSTSLPWSRLCGAKVEQRAPDSAVSVSHVGSSHCPTSSRLPRNVQSRRGLADLIIEPTATAHALLPTQRLLHLSAPGSGTTCGHSRLSIQHSMAVHTRAQHQTQHAGAHPQMRLYACILRG